MSTDSFLGRLIALSLERRAVVVLALILVVLGGVWSVREARLDAIPDLSDVQVIVYTPFPGQAPAVVEDQVTYPLTSTLLAVPQATTVRGYSHFGVSFVYVLFEDGTDPYWARARVLESFAGLGGSLPDGVTPRLGPDASGVGWAYMYALNSPRHDLAELRSIQDWYLRFGLASVEGVAEVASFGGFVRQLQVIVDPVELRAYGLSLAEVENAIRDANLDVGGELIEMGEREFMIRGRGYVESLADVEQVVLARGSGGVPVQLRDVATITWGPASRRGIAEWNGEGETVGGIVVVRHGADVLTTIDRIEAKLDDLRVGLPDGVEIEVGYDRSELIEDAVGTLGRTLLEESIVVALICALFLFHIRSALVAVVSIPVSILMAFIVMNVQGLGANIMSLGGIAISIGVLVDAAVVMIENAHKHLDAAEQARGRPLSERERLEVVRQATQEVGPTLFFTLMVITVSFLPVFTLQAEEGRLFRPLAFTKTWSMAAASLVAVTLMPVLTYAFVRGRIRSEERHPISRVLRAVYRPVLDRTLRMRWLTLVLATVVIASTWIPLQRIGDEFMPPLWEGDLLYMPTTFPGISITKARELLQQTDRIIASFPEVESVLGKIGRADTATDPAPLSMIETTIRLRPESEWREGLTREALIAELDQAIPFPGLTNAWTMPIRTRIDMLATGIRTPVGIKIAGTDYPTLERLAEQIEALAAGIAGTRSAYAERVMGGMYLDVDPDRAAAARYGLNVGEVLRAVETAVGGRTVSTMIDGRERYGIQVRYPRELRDDPEALGELLVRAPGGADVPLGRLAALELRAGPPMIKSEDARPNAWVYVDLDDGVDIGAWIREAKEAVATTVELPVGYALSWSGRWEAMERVR
ncbi:MAG: CusA/CzcA family heavy metal efflux RND transporter, partial [Acidobacteriota bacterium]